MTYVFEEWADQPDDLSPETRRRFEVADWLCRIGGMMTHAHQIVTVAAHLAGEDLPGWEDQAGEAVYMMKSIEEDIAKLGWPLEGQGNASPSNGMSPNPLSPLPNNQGKTG